METIKLDLIPGKKMPSLHASQYDDGRDYHIDLTENRAPYTLDGTETISLTVRKCDNTLVTMDIANTFADKSYIEFRTTEQMNACAGFNYGEITIEKNGTQISSLNFYLQVEGAPDEGGITSQSEINNLNRQVHDIVVEELEDNGASETGYDNTESGLEATNVQDAIDEVNTKIENIPSVDAYTKQESDEKYATKTELANKADASAIPTKTSQLQNDSGFTQIDDAEASANKTYSSNKIVNLLDEKANKSEVTAINDALYSISDNLFNFDDIVSNKVPASIGSNYDEFTNLSGWKTSNYIPVEAGQKYALILNGNITQGAVFRVACYKNGKETYKSEAQESNPYTIPNDVDHIRFFSNTSSLFASITATSFKKYDASTDTTWRPYGKTENYLKSKSVVNYGVFVSGSNYYHFVNFGNKTLIRLFKQEGPNNLFQFSALCEGGVYQNGIYISNTIATNGTDTVGPISIMRQGVDSGGNWSGGWHTKTINGVAYPTAEQNNLDIRVNGESIIGKNGMHYGKCVAIVKNSLYFPQTITGADLGQATKSIEETIEYILDDKMTARVSHKYVADTRVILYYGMQAVRVGFDSALLPNNENEIVFDSMSGDVILDNPERLIAVKNSNWNYDLILKDFGLAELKHNSGTGANKYGSLPQNTRKVYWVLIEGTYDYSFIPNGKILSWEGVYNIYPN